jgi:hypothetical protein
MAVVGDSGEIGIDVPAAEGAGACFAPADAGLARIDAGARLNVAAIAAFAGVLGFDAPGDSLLLDGLVGRDAEITAGSDDGPPAFFRRRARRSSSFLSRRLRGFRRSLARGLFGARRHGDDSFRYAGSPGTS